MKKNKKNGYTLFEFFMAMVLLAVILGIAVPIIMYALNLFRLNAYKDSAYNVIEAVKYYVATTNFNAFPSEGIEISELNLELKNNNYDSGRIKKLNNDKFELINLKQGNYCAKGTLENLKVSDKGCGTLDNTNPERAFVYLKNATNDSITVVASGLEPESDIKYYEFSIDGSKYTKKMASNEYTFTNLVSGDHVVKVRITNEANLSTESEEKLLRTKEVKDIECLEKNNLELYQIEKNYVCTYPSGSNYIYQYSNDDSNWKNINLTDDKYEFNFTENKTIYTRVIKDDNVVAALTLSTSNIDTTLNGAYPELLDNMIPVEYDSSQNAWVKADARKKYFDYENKMWANAVIVRKSENTDDSNSNSRLYYLSDEAIGKKIHEEDIIGYYVWIPRYSYNLFNVNSNLKEKQTIEISFENKKVTKKENDSVNSPLTHKAFSYNEEVNGFWVSKFQNSAAPTSSCYNNSKECNNEITTLYSVPNNNKISNLTISQASKNASSMIKHNNIYGMDESAKPHVLTNLEWGAIAYLTNSKYGVDENLTNNGSSYNNNLGNSTTGNITGVFDMVGNYQEMVMANYNNDAGKNEEDNSGFVGYGNVEWPSIIDYYSGITSKNRILGDATGETEGWYGSYAKFVNGENPFFIRGGSMDGRQSIYNFSSFSGNKNDNITFRTAIYK